MKKELISMTVLFWVLGLSICLGQSPRYATAMKSDLQLMQEAKTMQDFNRVSAAFSRIGHAEKTLWVPFYYAALSKLNGAMRDQSVDKDKIGEEVDSLLAQAEMLEKNSELTTLHYYNEILKMSVNPQARYMEAAPLLEQYYQTAVAQDSVNPRIYFMKGQTVFHTPESFGGGKKAAEPIFEKSVKYFELQDTTAGFTPRWGKQQAEAMLQMCKE